MAILRHTKSNHAPTLGHEIFLWKDEGYGGLLRPPTQLERRALMQAEQDLENETKKKKKKKGNGS